MPCTLCEWAEPMISPGSVGKARATMSAVWAESYDICGVGRKLRYISGVWAALRYLWCGEELRCLLCGGSVLL